MNNLKTKRKVINKICGENRYMDNDVQYPALLVAIGALFIATYVTCISLEDFELLKQFISGLLLLGIVSFTAAFSYIKKENLTNLVIIIYYLLLSLLLFFLIIGYSNENLFNQIPYSSQIFNLLNMVTPFWWGMIFLVLLVTPIEKINREQFEKELKIINISPSEIRRGWVRINEKDRGNIKSGSFIKIINKENRKEINCYVLGKSKEDEIMMDEQTREKLDVKTETEKKNTFEIIKMNIIVEQIEKISFFFNHPDFAINFPSKIAIISLIISILSIILSSI
jgi:hypothetical protein